MTNYVVPSMLPIDGAQLLNYGTPSANYGAP